MVDFVAVFEGVEADCFVVGRIFGFLLAGDAEAAAHQGGLPGAGDSGEDGEAAERDLNVEVVEVVNGAAFQLEPVLFGFEDLAT